MLPAGSRPSALPLDSPTSWQDKFSVSLEFSSRIPRRGVHMEQSSLAVSHGRDTEHTHAHAHMPMHACTHMRKTSGLPRPACCLLLPTRGLDSVAGERCAQIGEVGGGREKGLNGSSRPRCGARTKEAVQGWGRPQECSRWSCWCCAGPAWAGSSARAQPVPTRAGAQACSHPFPWAVVHSFRNSHDSQQPSPSAYKRLLHSRMRRRGPASKAQRLRQCQS